MTTVPFGPFEPGRKSNDEPGVGGLFGRLAAETGVLIRQELSLATLETAGKVKAIIGLASLVGVGALVALAGAQALLFGGILLLAMVIPLWLAAVSVGAVVAVAGWITIAIGRRALSRIELAPLKTIETLKENKTWAQQLVQ